MKKQNFIPIGIQQLTKCLLIPRFGKFDKLGSCKFGFGQSDLYQVIKSSKNTRLLMLPSLQKKIYVDGRKYLKNFVI